MNYKLNQICIAKEDFKPLYYKGDKFKIIKINNHLDLLPLECLHFKTRNVYGFEFEELQ
jgi:hypothetical protein